MYEKHCNKYLEISLNVTKYESLVQTPKLEECNII